MPFRRTPVLAATTAVATASALAGAAVPASAISVYSSPASGVIHTCTFPACFIPVTATGATPGSTSIGTVPPA